VTSRRPRPKVTDLESAKRRPVLGIASPTISPDGRWLAFRALNALWLAATDGKQELRKIVADGYFQLRSRLLPGRQVLALRKRPVRDR
jgi:hypothetical protein